jgi:hypothetical protein
MKCDCILKAEGEVEETEEGGSCLASFQHPPGARLLPQHVTMVNYPFFENVSFDGLVYWKNFN